MRRATRQAGRVAAQACGAAVLCALASGATAQQSTVIGGDNPPDVFVNMELLNSLGPGPLPYADYGGGAAGQAGQIYMNRPSTLLYPPPVAPRSQLTVAAPALDPGDEYESMLLSERVQLTPPAGMAEAEPGAPAQQAEERPPAPTAKAAPTAAKAAPAPQAPAKPDMQAAAATPEVPRIPVPSLPEQAAAAAETAPAAGSATVPAPPPADPPETTAAEAPATPEPPASSSTGMASASAPAAPPAPEPSGTASASSAPTAPEETPPAAAQQAALTTGLEERQMRLLFGAGSADLSDAAKATLRELAKELEQESDLRIQLLAYATTTEDSSSRARRLSLSRALAVRAYLIDQGVRSTRMDVRALGNKIEDGPADRVDIVPARR